MKKTLCYLFCCFSLSASAQAPFPAMDSINANNINALALVHGDMWWNPATGVAHCKFPATGKKNVGFASAVWMSGYDVSGQLHVAAQTYRQVGNDYWPGPLEVTAPLDYATSEKWAKIWKVTRTEVAGFRPLATHDLTNTPLSILTWPGRGNIYAKGNAGAPLTVTTAMAPFVDLNGDGTYQPLNGEYPAFPGEQALWWVFSDNGPTHSQTNGSPLKVEAHVLVYAFKRGTLIDNVVYYDYTIVNRSLNDYHDFRLALWDDVDLGYYMDDFIGFDSARRMGIVYSAVIADGMSAGFPVNSYGFQPPSVGVTLVSTPGDVGANYVPAGSYMYFNNDPSLTGQPNVDTVVNHYMRSKSHTGVHLRYDPITGSMVTGPDRNYVFADDPSIPGGWSECQRNNNPGDRRFVLTTTGFNLNSGQSQRIVMALVVADSAGGCPNADLHGLKEVADTAWAVYHSIAANVNDPVTTHSPDLTIYPNPAHDQLIIDATTCTSDISVAIYNIIGQQLFTKTYKPNTQTIIDISTYPPGIYFARCNGSGGKMFVKE